MEDFARFQFRMREISNMKTLFPDKIRKIVQLNAWKQVQLIE